MASPSPRRRFQFRLRTLLIGIMVFAVLCWIAADRSRLIRERDEAIERLHNQAEAMTWMERSRQLEDEVNRYRSMQSENKNHKSDSFP
jgi:hypothetical protein